MKLDDLETVSRLQTRIASCDFFLRYLYPSHCLKIWISDKGGVLERYGERHEYISEEAEQAIAAIVETELKARKAEFVDQLKALGVTP